MRMLVFWCLDSDAFTRLFSVFDWRKILAACSMLVRSGGAGMGNAESAAGDFLAVEMCILPWQDGALVAGMVWFWRSKDSAFILILIPSWVVSRLLPFGREEEESSTRSTESTTTGQQLSFWRDSFHWIRTICFWIPFAPAIYGYSYLTCERSGATFSRKDYASLLLQILYPSPERAKQSWWSKSAQHRNYSSDILIGLSIVITYVS